MSRYIRHIMERVGTMLHWLRPSISIYYLEVMGSNQGSYIGTMTNFDQCVMLWLQQPTGSLMHGHNPWHVQGVLSRMIDVYLHNNIMHMVYVYKRKATQTEKKIVYQIQNPSRGFCHFLCKIMLILKKSFVFGTFVIHKQSFFVHCEGQTFLNFLGSNQVVLVVLCPWGRHFFSGNMNICINMYVHQTWNE